jgi:pimeloyl-ACP methyl ester carboxylesterase
LSTFVLIHGGGHGGWCYKKVKQRLEAAGHEVYAPTLTGLAERSHLLSPAIDLEFHIGDIERELHYWDLSNVVLVGHSYGGMVISGVADRVPERVAKIVYLDAAIPHDGQAVVDVTGEMILSTRPFGKVVDGIELVVVPYPGSGQFYGVTDPDDLAWMDTRLTGHPWKCFDQPLRLRDEAALRSIPRYSVVCTSTLASVPPAAIAKARAEGRLFDIDTGHDLMITEPDWVSSVLLEIAAAPAR